MIPREIVSALLLTGVLAHPVIVHGQDNPNSASPNTTMSADRDDDVDFGWIGLLGLAGLMGLRRRDRDDVHARRPA